MKRRDFIFLMLAAMTAASRTARGQRRFKLGLLDTGLGAAFTVPFFGKLTELGYVEGKNLLVERRPAEGHPDRLPDLAAELVRAHVDVIVTAGTLAAFAAKKATTTLPIVMGAIADRVEVGLVPSLAHPGGNMTGNSLMAPDLSAKRIIQFANDNKLPSMFEDNGYVEAGGLMSYGPDFPDVFRKAAIFVDKIFKGASPADLPIEQPTKFEFVINRRTARAIGLDISPTLLALSDRVID